MIDRNKCEYLRQLAKQKFDNVRPVWVDLGSWAAPFRTKFMVSAEDGVRRNRHIVDTTHISALWSFVAGHAEGNTSSTRPWYRLESDDEAMNQDTQSRDWLKAFTRRSLKQLSRSNFYDATGLIYLDYGVFNTAGIVIDETDRGLFFHVLDPGSYYAINNSYGEAVILVREFTLTVKALVDEYGKKVNGKWDWSNFSTGVKDAYNNGNYTHKVDVVQVIKENDDFDPQEPQVMLNKRWISLTYEIGTSNGSFDTSPWSDTSQPSDKSDKQYLRVAASRRKPFIVARGKSSNNFEYGETGPTLDAIGLIKSLNKKAVGKDMALEQVLRPAMQGPANLKKSYISAQPGKYVPLDATSLAQKGMRPIFEINPAIGALVGDVQDLRQQVDRLYFADYLLYLSKNPKTRTAAETHAVVEERQLLIGPSLQTLTWTFNVAVVDFVADYVLDVDPHLPEMPEELAGRFVKPEFISVFAQAQRAADLPAIERYIAMITQVGQIQPQIWDKANVDKFADLLEDRLYLPVGLNHPQEKVEARRQEAMMQQQRQQQMEQLTQMSQAAKNVGIQANNNNQE